MLNWDPKPEIFTIPYLNWPILWYGLFFTLGFAVGFPIFVSILARYFSLRPENKGQTKQELKKKATAIADRLTFYMVVATVAGARVGHFLFYEKPSIYLQDPLEIFRIWEGGLASHGAVVAIILALILFAYRIRKLDLDLSWIRLLDFVSVPTAFAAFCIRVGNFFNQEILGTPTNVPWAVVFGHPIDHSLPVPRHPAQLYEAFFYLAVFGILFSLSRKPTFLITKGKLIGVFLILVFGFRFVIEFLKVEQSQILSFTSFLTMGQLLSLPVFVLGVIFYFMSPILPSSEN